MSSSRRAISRRRLLQRSAAGVVLIGATDILLTAPNAGVAPLSVGYGALVADPADRTLLESGQPTPGKHDGTGSFRHRVGTDLVNNHEVGSLARATTDGTVPGGARVVCGSTRARGVSRAWTASRESGRQLVRVGSGPGGQA